MKLALLLQQPTRMSPFSPRTFLSSVLLFGITLFGACASEPRAEDDEIVGALDGTGICGGTGKSGATYGGIRYRGTTQAVPMPASGAVLTFMTPHTHELIETTADDRGSFIAFANDVGTAQGNTITFDGVAYALSEPIHLSCSALGYRFIIEPNASGYLDAHGE